MAIKRAKWVEGITQSNRILRDIAEIITTAIQDENGIVEEENWQLIYPRPFEETDVERGALLPDENDDRGLRYIPTGSQIQSATIVGVDPIELNVSDVIPESVIVRSANGAVTYLEGQDYTYDAASNTVTRVDGGDIYSGSEITIEYNFTFNTILNTVPVSVEKKLTTPAEDREIDAGNYRVDYTGRFIEFLIDPPTAESFLLSFTERTGVYDRVSREKVKLQPDDFGGNPRKFILPSSYGEILQVNNYRTIASASSGQSGSGEVEYLFDTANKQVTFTEAPQLQGEDALFMTFYIDNTGAGSAEQVQRVKLEPNESDADGLLYDISAPLENLNDNYPHYIELFTINDSPKLYVHLNEEDAGYETIPTSDYVVDYENPSVNFITAPEDEFVITFKARGALDLDLGLSKIKDRVVVKTITTPDAIGKGVVDSDYGATDTAENLEMYVEFRKPERLINPETGLESYRDINGMLVTTQENNHYIEARMFDRWDDSIQGPSPLLRDRNGDIIDHGANVSNWSKYAWFQDWKEYLVDEIDDDPGISDLDKGVIFQEGNTRGMDAQYPVQFWISTNNNRIAMVLMGDPTLDQDNFLTSFAYFGRIQPFFDTQYRVKLDPETGECLKDENGDPIIEEVREYFENDVSGNFALTTGSSTIPADIGIPPSGQPILRSVVLNQRENEETGDTELVPGQLYDGVDYAYLVTYTTEAGESRPTPIDSGRLRISDRTVNPSAPTNEFNWTPGASIKLHFSIPQDATGYRIYRFHQRANKRSGKYVEWQLDQQRISQHQNYILVTSVNYLDGINREFEFVDDGSILPIENESGTMIANSWATTGLYGRLPRAMNSERSLESVIRDQYTGAILDVKFSDKFGRETATGVNDISMYQTRSGLKFQKHQPSFITTEEFMRKEKSGQSRWTGKFHLSPIYIEHSYDKQRGWLDGVMAVDDSGIAHLDELIVDKDTSREEVYKFFRVNAPYSMFNNSPNYAYGIAIVKSSLKWNN